MELSKETINNLTKRLLLSRTRVLLKYPFFGLLLMHVEFCIDLYCPTAYTDGSKIAFSPKFLNQLTDEEVDIVMMHEILHIVLKHCFRGLDLDPLQYNIACDIVVNSNIAYSSGLGVDAISLKCDKDPWRLAPNGQEGYLYTAEEVYKMLMANPQNKGKDKSKTHVGIDEHGHWQSTPPEEDIEALWGEWIQDAAKMASQKSNGIPYGVERALAELTQPKKDWREILSNFVQEEVNDYSFSPPDRRYEEDFFLPDFNDTDISVKKVLFMLDTSGSMSQKMITEMYSEVYGALEQFNGKLSGWLGFFDAQVVPPKPFESQEQLKIIKPKGGGGTDFGVIFEYIKKEMADDLPVAVIILTDGYASFPKEKDTLGIPVLWVLNTKVKPPFGEIIQI